jgi:hypothetical protein
MIEENMEVHHHPDLHHNKKNFREYFLEFLMIFLAVTMGFFAESLREHINNLEKEKQYMHSMIVDLKKDTIEINEEIVYSAYLMHGLDSLFGSLHAKKINDSIEKRLYYLNAKYNRLTGVQFSDNASVQLKNAGEMRLVQNAEVPDRITAYWKMVLRLQDDNNYFNTKMNLLGDEGYKIFDRIYIENYSHKTENGLELLSIIINPGAHLMTHDNNQLIEYANRVTVLSKSLEIWYVPALDKQKKEAASLIHLLQEKYN